MKKNVYLLCSALVVAGIMASTYVFGAYKGSSDATAAQPIGNSTVQASSPQFEKLSTQSKLLPVATSQDSAVAFELPTPLEETAVSKADAMNVVNVSYTQTAQKSANEDMQLVDAKVSPFSYPEITVEVGRPVRINFKVSSADDLNACNDAIIIPTYNIEKPLSVGDNFVEFTPTKQGEIPYSCWMDMIRSKIIVTASSVEQTDTQTAPQVTDTPTKQEIVEPIPQPTTQQVAAPKVSTDANAVQSVQTETVTSDGDITTIEAKVAAGGYPELIVELGKPIRVNFKVDANDLNSCNNEIIMPEWGIRKKLSVGDNFVEFTPSRTGDFRYTCWMGMIQSKVSVVEVGTGQVGALPLDASANQQKGCAMMSGNSNLGGGGCGMMSGGFGR